MYSATYDNVFCADFDFANSVFDVSLLLLVHEFVMSMLILGKVNYWSIVLKAFLTFVMYIADKCHVYFLKISVENIYHNVKEYVC